MTSSARLQKLVRKLPFTQTFSMRKIARAMLHPLYVQSNSDAVTGVLLPQAKTALVWSLHALSAMGLREVKSINSPPPITSCVPEQRARVVAPRSALLLRSALLFFHMAGVE